MVDIYFTHQPKPYLLLKTKHLARKANKNDKLTD